MRRLMTTMSDRRGEQRNRRDDIFDAAEKIFALRGYYGTSMRDIAAEADVNLGLLNYYFKTKEELFRQVVRRRRDDLHALVEVSLDAAIAAAGSNQPTPKALIRAFVAPFIECCVHGEEGWRYYVRLTSQFMNLYHIPELHDALTSLDPISQMFIERLRVLFPYMEERDFLAAIYTIEAALIFMVQDPGFMDQLTRGHHRVAQMDQMLDFVVPFFAAGIHALSESRP